MSRVVTVDLGARSYPIHIGPGLLPRLDELLKPVLKSRKALIVTDATVAPLYAATCAEILARSGIASATAIIPAGEASKNGRWLFHLYDKALEHGLDRKSCVIALGGGVVGDLAGYLAASFLRGLRFVQIPTTLLSMVDSAVGGKTGINLPQGKNLVGAFHQPVLVACDIDSLKTLSRRELAAGLAEVVKYGVIRDADLFALLEREADRIVAGDPVLLAEIVARSCEIKAEVVGKDEFEGGLRAILNYGHTLGHALEAVSGYGKYLHGEAISVGMVFAGIVSSAQCGFPAEDAARLVRLLHKFGLPAAAPEADFAELRQAMDVDKKTEAGRPKFVLARRIGEVEHGCEVPEDVLKRAWSAMPVRPGHGF